MSSSTLSALDRMISKVEALNVDGGSDRARGWAPATGAGADAESDYAWAPKIPAGHTSYSWTGVYGQPRYQIPEDAHKRAPSQPGPEAKHSAEADALASVAKENVEMFSRLEFRVGRIVSVRKHPDADSLYIERIDVGEPELREIVSGLVKFIPEDKMLNARCLVFTNLKANKLRGVLSNGMVLCAKNQDGTVVEFVEPPTDSQPGDRLVLLGFEHVFEDLQPDESVNVKKKNNPWTLLMPLLTTNENKVACFDGVPLHTSKGACVCSTLVHATLS